MTTPTPLTREDLDRLTELTRNGELGLELLDVPAELLTRVVAHVHRIEVLERLVVKLTSALPHGTALMLKPAEAAEYDRLLLAAIATVAVPAVGPAVRPESVTA